jgi:hypothetical protein
MDFSDFQGFIIAILGNVHSIVNGIPWMTILTVVLIIMQIGLIVRKWLHMNRLECVEKEKNG